MQIVILDKTGVSSIFLLLSVYHESCSEFLNEI